MPAPDPPCHACVGECCKQQWTGHRWPFAVEIQEDERALFPEAYLIFHQGEDYLALPYVAGKCIHLSDENRCKIYDKRPRLCREFNCVEGYRLPPRVHSGFVEDHPKIQELIQLHCPEYVRERDK